MPTFEPEDFLAGLHRLYEQQVKHDELIAKMFARGKEIDEQIAQLAEQGKRTDERLSKLIGVVGDLAAIVSSHEQRLQGLEGPA